MQEKHKVPMNPPDAYYTKNIRISNKPEYSDLDLIMSRLMK